MTGAADLMSSMSYDASTRKSMHYDTYQRRNKRRKKPK